MTTTSRRERSTADREIRVADRALERRVMAEHRGARRTLAFATALAFGAAACWIGFALLLSIVVDRVFLDGGTLGSVFAELAGMVGLVLARALLLWGS